jgi:hypothetical protein
MTKHCIPPATIAGLVAQIEKRWQVTLAPAKESRRA